MYYKTLKIQLAFESVLNLIRLLYICLRTLNTLEACLAIDPVTTRTHTTKAVQLQSHGVLCCPYSATSRSRPL